MISIKMIAKTEKKDGLIHVRFRLVDGRRADISHKTDILATPDEIDKFDQYGDLKPKVRLYNVELEDKITREKRLMIDAYKDLLEEGLDLTAGNLDQKILERVNPVQAERVQDNTLLTLFKKYADESLRDGVFGQNRYNHIMVVYGKLSRYLKIRGQSSITAREFDADQLWDFRGFIIDEYIYAKKYPRLYTDFSKKNFPTAPLSINTAASQMKMLQAFFNSLDPEQLNRSPFEALRKDRKDLVMRTMYDDPVSLTIEEVRKIMDFEAPNWLKGTKDAILVLCAIGARISDFKEMSMDNIGVTEDGIPFVHYLPNKTKRNQGNNKETETPLIRFAFDIIKKNNFKFKEAKYASGTNGLNAKLKQLLKICGIDRKVPVYNEQTGKNEYVPIYTLGCSKLGRKTNEDLFKKAQVNLYASGLHKEGSSAISRYTIITTWDRFILLSAGFEQDLYRVDKNLNVLPWKE